MLPHMTRRIGFVDVGSGGPLKHPWSLLPPDSVEKFDIDPERSLDNRPVCISDRNGEGEFHVAIDPRSSSLHLPDEDFIARFGSEQLRTARVITVKLQTLSDAFADLRDVVDAIDVNVEGHDAQVLAGAKDLFERNFVKLVKVEYELTSVWMGQGWFADIDSIMRAMGYDLAALHNELSRPAKVAYLRAPGEPIWGKAIYVASPALWRDRLARLADRERRDHCLAGICLDLAFDLPSRALDIATIVAHPGMEPNSGFGPEDVEKAITSIYGREWHRILAGKLARRLPLGLRAQLRPLVAKVSGS